MFRAKILVYIEAQEIKDGQPENKLISKEDLEQYGLKSKQTKVISGKTKDDMLTEINKWLFSTES